MRNPFDKILNWYFTKNSLPYWCIFLIDCAIVMFSCALVYWIFNNLVLLVDNALPVFLTSLVFTAVSVVGFRIFHTYSGFMRYASFVDLMRVTYGNLVNLGLALVADLVLQMFHSNLFAYFNTTSIFLIFILATLLMWALRVFVKTLYDVAFSNSRAMRVLVYGAMTGGVGLAKMIKNQRPRRYVVKGFISHYQKARHQQILGEKVYLLDDDLATIIKQNDIDAVLVSPYRVVEFRNNQAIQDVIIGAGAKILMAQGAKEFDSGDTEITQEDFGQMQLREVSVEELLPRDEIRVDLKSVKELLTEQRVLITGSAGSIGSEIVRQVSITHQMRMDDIFHTFRPDYVFHAAAYKHVPMMEDNPSEAVVNNIMGTKIIADLSVKYGVKKFVMVSTDKAVNPTNVMGCSKRICEIYVQSLDQAIKEKRVTSHIQQLSNKESFIVPSQMGGPTVRTQFVTTRFGNVLGSNGSVIPLFREQIKNGGPVTVTDERIVRFFMLIPEACKLVLEAGTKGNGGEIFVFDMG